MAVFPSEEVAVFPSEKVAVFPREVGGCIL